MKKTAKIIVTLLALVSVICIFAVPVTALAAGEGEAAAAVAAGSGLSDTAAKAIAAAIAIGIPAALGALAMGISIAKAVEGISRQPEASGKIQSLWMLGMVFVETVVIYALVVTILIVFIL